MGGFGGGPVGFSPSAMQNMNVATAAVKPVVASVRELSERLSGLVGEVGRLKEALGSVLEPEPPAPPKAPMEVAQQRLLPEVLSALAHDVAIITEEVMTIRKRLMV